MVNPNRRGRCYELAGRYVTDHGGTLVHGAIVSPKYPRPIGHAWVETPDGIWEPVGEETFDPERFLRLFHAVAIVRYDEAAVDDKTLRTGTWGPWDDRANIPDARSLSQLPWGPKVGDQAPCAACGRTITVLTVVADPERGAIPFCWHAETGEMACDPHASAAEEDPGAYRGDIAAWPTKSPTVSEPS